MKRYTILTATFCVCLIASNLFETKIFNAGPLTLTGGLLVFPLSYIINDCLSEIYGFKKARTAILSAFALNAGFVVLAQLVRILPPAPFWNGQEHFDYIFRTDLRITVASMLAFVFGSLINSRVMCRMKEVRGEKGFGRRAVASSLAGESIDSVIFFPIAFWGVGVTDMFVMMVTQIVLKTLYEVILLPVTSQMVKRMKE